jgi:hypothetical protein
LIQVELELPVSQLSPAQHTNHGNHRYDEAIYPHGARGERSAARCQSGSRNA